MKGRHELILLLFGEDMLPSSREISIKQKQSRKLHISAHFETNGDYKVFRPEYTDLIPAGRSFSAASLVSDAAFEAEFSYPLPEISLTLLEDVYVSRSGAVCTGDGDVVDETLEAAIDVNFDRPLSEFAPADTVTAASKYGNFNHAIFTMETLPLVILSQMDGQAAAQPRSMYFERRYCGEPAICLGGLPGAGAVSIGDVSQMGVPAGGALRGGHLQHGGIPGGGGLGLQPRRGGYRPCAVPALPGSPRRRMRFGGARLR